MRELEAIGKTVDEAIQSGLSALGLTRDEVEIRVLDEGSRGFLGLGYRHARVRVVALKEPEADSSATMVKSWLGLDDATPASTEEEEVQEETEHDGVAEASPGVVYLRGLLERMGLEADVAETEEDDISRLDVEGKALGVLIGRHGETLDAIQYLVNLSVNKRSHLEGVGEYARYVVDVAGYRRKREESLNELAITVARRVLRDGKDQALVPMSALERRVVHMSLKDMEGISTHSEGKEPFRRIVISRANVQE